MANAAGDSASASQLSVVHKLPSSHTNALPGTHAPPAHASPVVHKLPSLHGRLFVAAMQPVLVLQVSVVQGLPSSQLSMAPDWHWPPWHASPMVQALPSEQAPEITLNTQPLAGAQLSLVHTLPSLHAIAAPETHTPPAQ